MTSEDLMILNKIKKLISKMDMLETQTREIKAGTESIQVQTDMIVTADYVVGIDNGLPFIESASELTYPQYASSVIAEVLGGSY